MNRQINIREWASKVDPYKAIGGFTYEFDDLGIEMVDGFSASHIVAVYDALNDENKAKYAALHVAKMASIGAVVALGGGYPGLADTRNRE